MVFFLWILKFFICFLQTELIQKLVTEVEDGANTGEMEQRERSDLYPILMPQSSGRDSWAKGYPTTRTKTPHLWARILTYIHFVSRCQRICQRGKICQHGKNKNIVMQCVFDFIYPNYIVLGGRPERSNFKDGCSRQASLSEFCKIRAEPAKDKQERCHLIYLPFTLFKHKYIKEYDKSPI